MANAFPAAIANEPPPCISSEDEDSEEFHGHGLKLDVPSGDPTPVSTPRKKPTQSTDQTDQEGTKTKSGPSPANADYADIIDNGDKVGIVNVPSMVKTENISEKLNEQVPKENGYASHLNSNQYGNLGQSLDDDADGSIDAEENLQISVAVEVEEGTSACKQDAAEFCDNNNTANITVSESEPEPTSPFDSCEDTSRPEERKEKEEEWDSKDIPIAELENKQGQVNVEDNVIVYSQESSGVAHGSLSPELHESLNTTSGDDEFDDFGAFQSIPNQQCTGEKSKIQENIPKIPSQVSEFDDDGDDDDFGDFAQVPIHKPETPKVENPTLSKEGGSENSDFADFQDCSFHSDIPTFNRKVSTSTDIGFISGKMDTVVKSLFTADPIPETNLNFQTIDTEISISKDDVWSRVQDFESSQGLMYKWLNSLTEKRLLRSLNIDNSNIMYHEKWGTIEVPKFAASLVMSPLKPESCSNSISQTELHGKCDTRNMNNNNIKERMSCQDQDKPPSISAEAQDILRQLPDLSYMRANTLVFPQTSPSGI